ncbi:MAG: tRNA preQ1(34) S-adenosylmethionine ribosyltransferase-isomerase QueA [Desulfobacterales bacterium]|nr:MAG: tRNA preQ1(34) S-adenosylmethionine ribosyltransferase-isomerase QueA [Desulfobacterales bacterium]
MFSLSDYDYDLPAELIAQKPLVQRDRSNLLFLNRRNGTVTHHCFGDLCRLLRSGDVLVLNNTAVIPGRLCGHKETGGKVEVLIFDFAEARRTNANEGEFICQCLVKAAKRSGPGTRLFFEEGLTGEIIDSRNGTHTVRFYGSQDFEALLDRIGHVPLPPYIKRGRGVKPPCDDRTSYQTVYASQKGAIAAPTAGLHFTAEMLVKLRSQGVQIVAVTLHVGYGTFLPVRVSDIRRHRMHAEGFCISTEAAETIKCARAGGGRVVAVGTTCVRTLEYASDAHGHLTSGSGKCDLFIYPGYRFKIVNALITNFHLPESTLLMLVAAFAGRENVLNAYQEAITRRYRFYSYGDAMYIA